MKTNLVVIKTHKIRDLQAFYPLLGCQFDYHQRGKGVFRYATNINGIVFEIYPLPKKNVEADTTTRLGFEVENLDKLIENLKEKAVSVLTEPVLTEYGYSVIIEDLDGRKIELVQKYCGGPFRMKQPPQYFNIFFILVSTIISPHLKFLRPIIAAPPLSAISHSYFLQSVIFLIKTRVLSD